MRGFDYIAAADVASTLAALPQHTQSLGARNTPRLLAGGTNLIDLMKEDVLQPGTLVGIGQLPLDAIEETADGGLRLGALARNADTAKHPLVASRYPLLAAAILAGASPQIRNMATNGGNLLQRTRCYYFYDVGVPCNKREPGSGCPALHGLARQLAILGTSEQCIATHPSDMCVALAALNAVVHVRSEARGAREVAFTDFHRLPGDQPQLDTTLEADELVTHIELPPPAFTQRCAYLKLRGRASYAFALVSVAVAFELDTHGRMRQARVALGGVAAKPWRDREAEGLLEGQPLETQVFEQAAERLLEPARAFGSPGGPGHNGFKIPLARRAVVRALEMARDGELTNTGELAADRFEDGQ